MKKETKRLTTQIGASVAQNAYVAGFFSGTVFGGGSKALCVPGLNCYSCPSALASCPVGALQTMLSSWRYHYSMYVLGLLLLFGVTMGRWICGWICPFGMLQDLLYRIPGKKLRLSRKVSWLRLAKYAVLIVLVILLPLVAVDSLGGGRYQGEPWFCKYLCPAGTVQGALPLVTVNTSLQDAAGWLFAWKVAVAGAILLLSVFLYRFFCRFLCPLGAIYGLLNRLSLYRMRVAKQACTNCGTCKKVCKMDVNPIKTPNSVECIRCGCCVSACPNKALEFGFSLRDKKEKKLRVES